MKKLVNIILLVAISVLIIACNEAPIHQINYVNDEIKVDTSYFGTVLEDQYRRCEEILMPLNVGNEWDYRYLMCFMDGPSTDEYAEHVRIVAEETINGNKWFKAQHRTPYGFATTMYYTNTTTGLFCKLSKEGDSVMLCSSNMSEKFLDTTDILGNNLSQVYGHILVCNDSTIKSAKIMPLFDTDSLRGYMLDIGWTDYERFDPYPFGWYNEEIEGFQSGETYKIFSKLHRTITDVFDNENMIWMQSSYVAGLGLVSVRYYGPHFTVDKSMNKFLNAVHFTGPDNL